ncbi:YueI family protein [Lacticaseibacillus chiayiensis]|uniref:YueI family protein n=1 Tax=Lacticaseibacillus chiayiensis TaxID=2100821 RepID=UPI001BD03850|nr:YueI family protein [Lacticaseibacillus chiayiensis]QVI35677.1 YueI family protein [Lacticaseibacillus chiayiensis]
MSDDNMQVHLNNALYGPPQTNPDERRRFMGSLRERVALRVSNQELADPARQQQVAPLLKDFHDHGYKALLNGKLDNAVTGPYMKMLTGANIPFTLVANETAQTDEKAAGLLIVSDKAINQNTIDLPPLDPDQDKPKPKKYGFDLFKHL